MPKKKKPENPEPDPEEPKDHLQDQEPPEDMGGLEDLEAEDGAHPLDEFLKPSPKKPAPAEDKKKKKSASDQINWFG